MDRGMQREIERLLGRLSGQVEGVIPPSDVEVARGYREVGEYGFALHTTVFAIIEEDKQVFRETLLIVVKVVTLMRIDDFLLDDL
jgi:hypothetical protein